jgi:catechol 2,3-dioxygenase-like lactoylglutathione lyase family enzyme
MIHTAIKVTGIDHVVLHVRDPQRSKRFYVDLLGLEVDRERPAQIFLRCGTQQVGLFAMGEGEELHGGNEVNHLALRMADGTKASVKAALEAAGVKVHGRPGDEDCVYFEDPDGHRLQLYTLEDQEEGH